MTFDLSCGAAPFLCHSVAAALGGIELIHAGYDQLTVSRMLHDNYVVGVAEGAPHNAWTAGAWRRVEPGMLLLIAPNQVYGLAQLNYANWGYRFFFLSRNQITALAGGRDVGFKAPVVSDSSISRALAAAHERLFPGDPDERATTLLRTALSELNLRWTTLCSVGQSVTSRASEYIRRRFNERIRIADVAAHVGLSEYHLSRVFHEAVGLPPYTYLDQVRVARARTLLAQGSPISEVAEATGFSDQAHLTRHFKRTLGITPGYYCRVRRQAGHAA